MNYSKAKAASTVSNLSYLRPLCAIFAGLIADKISATKLSIYLFITLTLKLYKNGRMEKSNCLWK